MGTAARDAAEARAHVEQARRRAGDLLNILRDEVEESAQQRELLIDLDADALLTRAARRDAFNANAAAMQEDVAAHLRRAADALGLTEVTFEALGAHLPDGVEALKRTLSEVGHLAAELRRLDETNLLLGRRALAITRGYFEALLPQTAAYDRSGRARESRAAVKGDITLL